MSLVEALTLFGMMVSLAALPSASVALVVTRSATLGLANGLAVVGGIILGDLILILLAILGLSVVSQLMGDLFILVKYLGAFYLIWLGYTLLTSAKPSTKEDSDAVKKQHMATSFFAGLVLTLGDVKAIFFYASLFPLFVNLVSFQTTDILVILSLVLFSLGSVKILYAYSASKIVSFISDKSNRLARKTVGGFMLAAGGYLIVKDA